MRDYTPATSTLFRRCRWNFRTRSNVIHILRREESVKSVDGCSCPSRLLARLRFPRCDFEVQLLCAANDEQQRLVADAIFSQQLVQIVDTRDGSIVEADDDVAFTQPRFLSRTLLLKRDHQNPALNRKIVIAHDASRQRHVLSSQSYITATDFAVANQSAGYELRRVNRGRKADALRRQDHRRVHTDHFATRVDERATRVTRVERRVGLNNRVHQTSRARAQRPTERAHHACRDAVLEPVRITDRQHELANTNLLRLAEMSGHKVRCIDPDYGEIGIRVVADQLRLVLVAVRDRDFNLRCAMDDVTVRQNETVRRKDKTRSTAARFLWHARIISASIVCCLLYFDIDDRRAHALGRRDYGSRIGIQQLSVIGLRYFWFGVL